MQWVKATLCATPTSMPFQEFPVNVSKTARTFVLVLVVSTTQNCVVSSELPAQQYSQLIVFGGNFEDSGNDAIQSPPVLGFSAPPSPPYFEGRFSNGPTWVDILADRLGMPRPSPSEAGGRNYAYGGASSGSWPNPLVERFGILNVNDQVALFLEDNVPSGDELFFVPGWTSIVDFGDGQPNVDNAAATVGQSIADLAVAGAREVIVMNLPPGSRGRFDLSGLLEPYNSALAEEIQLLREEHAGLKIYEFDAYRVVAGILDDPGSIGISILTGQACDDCGTGDRENPTQIADNPNDYLYWDLLDFTVPVHEALGNAAFQLFTDTAVGDLDQSGSVEAADLDLMADAIRASNSDARFDLNGDGRVDVMDHEFLVNDLAKTTPGDANLDGATNFADFLTLADNFGAIGGWGQGNFDLNTTVDFTDFLVLSANFQGPDPQAEFSSVPEPRRFYTAVVFAGLSLSRFRSRMGRT